MPLGADPYENPLFSDEFKKLAEQVIDEHADEVSKKIVGKSPEDASTIAGGFPDEARGKLLAKWREQYSDAVGAVSNDDVAGVVGGFMDGGAEAGDIGLFLPAIVMQKISAGLDAISLAHASPIATQWLAEREKELMAEIIKAGKKRQRSLMADFRNKPADFWPGSQGPRVWYGSDAAARVDARQLVNALKERLSKGGYAVSNYGSRSLDISW